MTPLAVRKAAFQYERTHPDATPSEAFMQGYLHASHSLSSSTENTEEQSFAHAWNLYDRKDNKQSALKEWNKLSESDRVRALQHIPPYVRAHPEKKYRPMFATYLHQKRFLDEEIITTNGPTQQQQRFAAYANAINNLNPKM